MKLNKEHEVYPDLRKHGYLFSASEKTVYIPVNYSKLKADKNLKTDVELANELTKYAESLQLPEEFNAFELECYDVKEYYNTRLQELGIDENNNKVDLFDERGSKYPAKIFNVNKLGDIEITQFSLERKPHVYSSTDPERATANIIEKQCVQTRLHPLHEDMCNGKYSFKEAVNEPFWHPRMIELFENEEKVETLVITEGQFKAFKAVESGTFCVGLTSISHYKNKNTQDLHKDILDFIRVCNVEKIVILWDGDCRDISTTAIKEKKDLHERPGNFYNFACKIRELLQKYYPAKSKKKVIFSTLRTATIPHYPKGIDDLFISNSDATEAINAEVLNIGELPCKYFEWLDITTELALKNLRPWFMIDNVYNFYRFHQEKIGQQDFIFKKTTFKVDNNEPLKKIDANLKNFFRIGTDYYYLTREPVPNGLKNDYVMEPILLPWKSEAIKLDYGKDSLNHVQRYKGFTNVPEHLNYEQDVQGFWNLYLNLTHDVDENGDFPTIRAFLKHLFEEHFDNDMIYDYLTILYRYPTQKLPVICLVSKAQGTGKSTFLYLLKLLFKQNMTLVSNSDLTGDFNAHWVSKLLVASEETLLEKKDGYEKIKSISTARTIPRNEKNKSSRDIPCFVHFVFCSNHEDDFIKIDDSDSRLWIRKVKKIEQMIEDFENKLASEIAAFVHFLINREITNPREDRLWFAPWRFLTDAKKNVIKNSEPAIIKEIKEKLIDSFIETGANLQQMDASMIRSEFGLSEKQHYLTKELKRFFGEPKNSSFKYYYVVKNGDGKGELRTVEKKGRFYEFDRSHFLLEEDTKPKPKLRQTSIMDYEDKAQ